MYFVNLLLLFTNIPVITLLQLTLDDLKSFIPLNYSDMTGRFRDTSSDRVFESSINYKVHFKR